MLRRLNAKTTARVSALTTTPQSTARRNLEPMSVWYLASWTCMWYYAFFFWMPMLWTDMIVPSFVYNKLPLIHFMQEKRAEQKLRRELDETSTEWTTEMDHAHITDAINRAIH